MRYALVALTMLCTGCALFTEPLAPPYVLSVDRTEYAPRLVAGEGILRFYAFTMVAQFANGSRDTVFLDRCGTEGTTPIYGILMADGRESAFNLPWACPASRPIAVAPGQARVDTLEIWGPGLRDGFTQEPRGELSGRMVLMYGGYSCRSEVDCPPLSPPQTRPFLVTTPP